MKQLLFVLTGVLATLPTAIATANVDDEKPWDWDTLAHQALRAGAGTCDGVADDLKDPALQCSFDKKPWDAHLAKELKIERIRDRNHMAPDFCIGAAFYGFRGQLSNGFYPEAEPVAAEFRDKVATLECTFDDVETPPFVTYNAGAKKLVMHMTRQQVSSADWIPAELRTPAMKKIFPALNHYWAAHS